MGTLTNILVIFTIINAGFFIFNVSNNSSSGSPIGFLGHFINTNTNTPSSTLTEATTTNFYGSSAQSGTTSQGFYNLIDPLNAVLSFLDLITGLLGGFLSFAINVGAPTWFIYLVALPMTAAYWVAIAAFIRGVLA